MMPSSNLHDFWWVYWMYVHFHFPCKIFWPFGLTHYPRGSKNDERNFFKNQVWIIVNFMRWNLTDSDGIFKTLNLRRFLNFTQISWRFAQLSQKRISACHYVSLSVSLCMFIYARRMTGLRWNWATIDWNECYNHRACLKKFDEDCFCNHCQISIW